MIFDDGQAFIVQDDVLSLFGIGDTDWFVGEGVDIDRQIFDALHGYLPCPTFTLEVGSRGAIVWVFGFYFEGFEDAQSDGLLGVSAVDPTAIGVVEGDIVVLGGIDVDFKEELIGRFVLRCIFIAFFFGDTKHPEAIKETPLIPLISDIGREEEFEALEMGGVPFEQDDEAGDGFEIFVFSIRFSSGA